MSQHLLIIHRANLWSMSACYYYKCTFVLLHLISNLFAHLSLSRKKNILGEQNTSRNFTHLLSSGSNNILCEQKTSRKSSPVTELGLWSAGTIGQKI